MALVPVSEWKDSLQSFRELRDSDAGRGTNWPELENILVFIIYIYIYIKISIIILFFWVDLCHFVTLRLYVKNHEVVISSSWEKCDKHFHTKWLNRKYSRCCTGVKSVSAVWLKQYTSLFFEAGILWNDPEELYCCSEHHAFTSAHLYIVSYSNLES